MSSSALATAGASKKKRAGLRAATFAYVEQQLHDYQRLKERLDERTAEVAERGMGIAYDEQSHHREASPEWSDPTHKRATRLMNDKSREELAKTVAAIRFVYQDSFEQQRQVMKRYYWERVDQKTVARELDVHPLTVARLRQQLVTAVAEEMGLW